MRRSTSLLLMFGVILFVFACTKNSADKKAQDSTISSQPTTSTVALTLDSTQYFFEGSVGEKAKVNAQLTLNRGEISGSYRYYTGSRGLSLRGTVQADNTVQLLERDDMGRGGWEKDSNSTVSGRLIGKLNPSAGTITGTWTSKDGTKSLPFSLRAVAKFEILKSPRIDVATNFPVFAALELDNLNDTLLAMAQKDYATMCASVDTTRKEYLEMEEMKERAEMISEHSYAEVVFASPNLVSILWNNDSYGGGAHGNYGFNAITWKIEQGKPMRLALGDLFNIDSDYPSLLSKLLVAELRKQEASSVVDGSVTSLGDDIMKGNIPFTVHSSGLTFYFAPYYVASYAEGAFEIHIPWKQLKTLLRQDGVFSFLPS